MPIVSDIKTDFTPHISLVVGGRLPDPKLETVEYRGNKNLTIQNLI